ncbi:MAG TPA: histidinol dehydrogenase [Chitinophagaceae bacterium]|nr:histidinol dehydrogenase [Chitinophagaceae bacterium]
MQLILLPNPQQWPDLLRRPALEASTLDKDVRRILLKVKKGGDKAIKKLTLDIDGVKTKDLLVSAAEIRNATADVPAGLQKAIGIAASNIEKFHSSQLHEERVVETMPGVKCWRKSVPIERIGLYIPGGTAPLFSTVLMLGIPARLAGCREIILCTPPQTKGMINPAILYAAQLAGITRIYKAGGAQAIAAMAYGTESIPKVYKIFGPGNQYVNLAKQLVQMENTAIDMPAGPSEVCVLADETANENFVAADLLSQAEHGPDSQVLLVTPSSALAYKVKEKITQQLANLPRKTFAMQSLLNSKAVVVNDMDEGIALVNEYAAEHLIIACDDAESLSKRIVNAGSVFLGHYSPESAGDYASGTNHTLPTHGFARMYSGVSVDSFVKKITYQHLTQEGLANIGEAVQLMATAEGLEAHARAIGIRITQGKA